MKKTLGGNRLGSGAGMEVEIGGHARSTHNLNTTIKTTMGIGTLIPIHHSIVLAGDTRELQIDAKGMTHPTEGPLFGSFKLQIDVFKVDMRLYIAKLHMNLLDQGLNMADIKMPQLMMEADKINWANNPSNQQINPSCIFSYLMMSGLGDKVAATGTVKRQFNAIPFLAYWDIFKQYYANKQEKNAYVIHNAPVVKTLTSVDGRNQATITPIPEDTTTPGATVPLRRGTTMVLRYSGAKPIPDEINLILGNGTYRLTDVFESVVFSSDGTGPFMRASGVSRDYDTGSNIIQWWGYVSETTPRLPQLKSFPLKNIDDMKMDILTDVKSNSAFIIGNTRQMPYNLPFLNSGTVWTKQKSQEGLAVKTYQSDLFNNWLNTEYIDGPTGINARTAIQVDANGKFTIDNFLIKEKMYNYLNKIAVAGATVEDMMEVTYDVKSRTRPERPTFEGGMSKELVFEEVLSNTATADQPLGTIAGKGVLTGHNGGTIRITNDDTQHAIYMVMASLTPRVVYSQGNRWDTNLKTYDDLHKPDFDQIGFQDFIIDQAAYWETILDSNGIPTFTSAGKQPAWTNYQTEVDRVFGNFAIQESEGWMVLNRNYDWDQSTKKVKDMTTYIDPAKYNGVFAYAARDAQNIWLQVRIEDKAIRKMSANQFPRL